MLVVEDDPINRELLARRLERLGYQVDTAENGRNRKLTNLSFSDGLTGIANRVAFDDYLQREWRRASREKQPLALILIDIDDFKPYNDTYGHEAGDNTLRAVAHALEEAAERSSDMVARYGGEEFAVVLPHTDAAGAAAVAARMRAAVSNLGIAHSVSRAAPTVTISAGVACIGPNSLSDQQAFSQQAASGSQTHASATQSLIDAADKALYRAKHAGRNQVQTSAGCTTG